MTPSRLLSPPPPRRSRSPPARRGSATTPARAGNGSAENKAEEGQLSISAPGVEMKIDIPEGLRREARHRRRQRPHLSGRADERHPCRGRPRRGDGPTARSSCASPAPTRPTRSRAGIAIRPAPATSPSPRATREGAAYRLRRHQAGTATAASASAWPPRAGRRHRRPGRCSPTATDGRAARRSRRRCARISSRAAKAGIALSYGELLEHLGYRFSRPKMRALCAMLGDDRPRGRGARRARAGRAGRPRRATAFRARAGGWPAAARSAAMRGPGKGRRRRASSRAVQAETFAFWQSRNGTVAGNGAALTISRSPIGRAVCGIEARERGPPHAQTAAILLRAVALAGLLALAACGARRRQQSRRDRQRA